MLLNKRQTHVVLTGYNPALSPTEVESWARIVSESAKAFGNFCDSVTLVTNHSVSRFEHVTMLESNIEVCYLKGPPQGALATACIGVEKVRESSSLIIAPGDTIVTDEFLRATEGFYASSSLAGVTVFSNPPAGRNWSYVHKAESGSVTLVSESTKPTENATSGHFYFENKRIFLEAATWCFRNHAQTSGQYYTSGALNYLISTGERIQLVQVNESQFFKSSV